jgi:hypothetical protein
VKSTRTQYILVPRGERAFSVIAPSWRCTDVLT